MLLGGAASGGGGGGRVAIYHRDNNDFTGEYLVHGGKGTYLYGGAGTVYIEAQNAQPNTHYLLTDNGGYSSSNRIEEVERLNLTGNYFTTNNYPERTFHTHSGINITTDAQPYSVHQYNGYYDYYSHTYPLSHMFSDVSANVNYFYMSLSQTANLTFDLPFPVYVEYLRIYPYCDTDYTHYERYICMFYDYLCRKIYI